MNSFINTSKHFIKTTTALTNLLRNGSLINKSVKTRICLFSSIEATNNTETQPLISYPSPTSDKQYSENIRKIVSDISQLTLLEVSELNELLKKTLNISDAPMMAFGAMPNAQQSQTAEEEDTEKSFGSVQTAFTLKLNKFDDTKKVVLIKEVKNIVEGMNLVQAKKFVESVPQTLKTNLSKDEAEKLKSTLEALGGICEIV